MDFFVYSRGAIEALPPHDEPHVIISITTTPDDVARLRIGTSCRGILRLSFFDVEVPVDSDRDGVFGLDHAGAICDFVELHRGSVSRIVVHCDAGISRSPAVAAALAVCLGESDDEFFRRYRPNMLVYRTLLDEWWRRRSRAASP
jgi:predicted protein tyrosine phosphatase